MKSKRIEFMRQLCDEFREYVVDSILDFDKDLNFEDHMLFLEISFDSFIEMKKEEEKYSK